MKRRDFIILVGGAAAWPTEMLAQEPGRTYHLGGLTPSARDAPHYAALFDELGRLGYVDGQNLVITKADSMRMFSVSPSVTRCGSRAGPNAVIHNTALVQLLWFGACREQA